MSDAQVLEFIAARMRETFLVRRILLFGSRGRGDASGASDYDVLVIADTDIPFVERQGLALKSLGPRSFPVDLLVYTPVEMEREASVLGSAVYWALQEGQEIYAA